MQYQHDDNESTDENDQEPITSESSEDQRTPSPTVEVSAMRETRQKQLVEAMEQAYSAHYKEEIFKLIKRANIQCAKPTLQSRT